MQLNTDFMTSDPQKFNCYCHESLPEMPNVNTIHSHQVDTQFPRATFEPVQQHPISLQESILFAYKNYEVVNKKQIAECKMCRSKVTDGDAAISV